MPYMKADDNRPSWHQAGSAPAACCSIEGSRRERSKSDSRALCQSIGLQKSSQRLYYDCRSLLRQKRLPACAGNAEPDLEKRWKRTYLQVGTDALISCQKHWTFWARPCVQLHKYETVGHIEVASAHGCRSKPPPLVARPRAALGFYKGLNNPCMRNLAQRRA